MANMTKDGKVLIQVTRGSQMLRFTIPEESQPLPLPANHINIQEFILDLFTEEKK